jgi:CDP-paratose synthetase
MNVLLTGATGFLGSHILHALIDKGYNVIVLKRSSSNDWRIKDLVGKYTSYDIDINNIDKVFDEKIIDHVIHTACYYGRNDDAALKIIESNILYGIRLLDNCKLHGIKSFINSDTFFNNNKYNQNYLSSYTLSKKHFVDWMSSYTNYFKVINLRIHHMYGPKDNRDKFIPWFIHQMKCNVDEIKLSSGKQKRDFIYISDVVGAFLLSIEKINLLENYTTVDVATGRIQSLEEFLRKVKDVFTTYDTRCKTLLSFGAKEEREGEIMDIEVNNKILLDLGWDVSENELTNISNTICG